MKLLEYFKSSVPFIVDEMKDTKSEQEIIDELKADINIQEWTFKGGMKTEASKNRIVPIHTLIRPFVAHRLSEGHNSLFAYKGITRNIYTHKNIEELRAEIELIKKRRLNSYSYFIKF